MAKPSPVDILAAAWKVGEIPAGTTIHTAAACHAILRSVIGDLQQEAVCALALNARSRVIGARIVSLGTATECLITPALIYRDAIQLGAAGVILSHNHPSGEPEPSAEDLAITRRLREAGKLLDIELMDHLIIAGPRYVSLKQEGYL